MDNEQLTMDNEADEVARAGRWDSAAVVNCQLSIVHCHNTALMIDTHHQIREQRSLWAGALFWVVFSCVAVTLRGVRWEETWEHALVITGAVPYPEGHPFYLYCRNVFSGQSYLSALMLSLWDSPLLINGLRNLLQLSFCTVPVFYWARVSAVAPGADTWLLSCSCSAFIAAFKAITPSRPGPTSSPRARSARVMPCWCWRCC